MSCICASYEGPTPERLGALTAFEISSRELSPGFGLLTFLPPLRDHVVDHQPQPCILLLLLRDASQGCRPVCFVEGQGSLCSDADELKSCVRADDLDAVQGSAAGRHRRSAQESQGLGHCSCRGQAPGAALWRGGRGCRGTVGEQGRRWKRRAQARTRLFGRCRVSPLLLVDYSKSS